jgi:hypothetical protein
MAKTALLNQIKTSLNGVSLALSGAYDKIRDGSATKAELEAIITKIEAVEKAFNAMEAHIKGWENPGFWAKLKGTSPALTQSRNRAREEFNRLKNLNGHIIGGKALLKKAQETLA